MSKINEILTAIILYSIMSYILMLPCIGYHLMIAILASQLNIIMPKNYKHTLIWYMPLAIMLTIYPTIAIALATGYTASIFITLLSKNGCKLLYPVKETTFTGPDNYLENDTKKDYAASIFLATLVTITLLLSFNGTEIIEQLSQENTIYLQDNDGYHNNSPAVHYININPSYCLNRNITTTKTENTTTTIITEYEK